jgi:hypothetical protein
MAAITPTPPPLLQIEGVPRNAVGDRADVWTMVQMNMTSVPDGPFRSDNRKGPP